MWDERYAGDEYAYGKAPNDFLATHFSAIPKGKVLSLAEGEGRNAVFLAKQGYEVTAVDGSKVGLAKAQKLAEENGVTIECIHADLAEFALNANTWDGIVSIFCPLSPQIRQALYQNVIASLKPGGVFLCEAYTPEQIKHGTGGGNAVDVMQTRETLNRELEGLAFEHLLELEREVIEGQFHTGLGAVVQAIAKKP